MIEKLRICRISIVRVPNRPKAHHVFTNNYLFYNLLPVPFHLAAHYTDISLSNFDDKFMDVLAE